MGNQIENLAKEHFSRLSREIEPGKDYIPVSGKVFDEKELLLGIEAVLDGFWTHGRFSQQLEEKLAGFVGCKNALLCNSGSSANFLAFTSLFSHLLGGKRLGKGAEVVTTAASC